MWPAGEATLPLVFVRALHHHTERFTRIGCQAVVLSMSVSIMAPVLALRGPDGSLHDAILGMQKWTSFVIVLFLSSILLCAAAPKTIILL